jgi:hypothetical protein
MYDAKHRVTFQPILVGAALWLTSDWFVERRTMARKDAHVQEIVSLLGLAATPNFHYRLDKVRTFINDNSIHKIDKAFWDIKGQPDMFAAGVLAHAKGTSAAPVHMECSTRTYLMGSILQALGYNTRVVAIFNSRTNLKSHSFLEIMNPDTGRWETQDADYDIYWRNKSSGERLSLAETAESIDEIEPCGRDGCGWGHASREGIKANKLIGYLDLISITTQGKAMRYALFTSRADLNRSYSKGSKRGAFCEVEAKRCEHGFYDIRKYSSYEPGLLR